MPGKLARRLALSGMLSVGLVAASVSAADDPPLDNSETYGFEGIPFFPIPLPWKRKKTYDLGKRGDAHTFLSSFNVTCANTRFIPATGSRAREACDGFSEWRRRGYTFETIRGNQRLLEEYARLVWIDCSDGVMDEDLELCKIAFKVELPVYRWPAQPPPPPPLGPPPETPPTPPKVGGKTVRVASNCAVVEVTPREKGVAIEEENCALELLGEVLEQTPPPHRHRLLQRNPTSAPRLQ